MHVVLVRSWAVTTSAIAVDIKFNFSNHCAVVLAMARAFGDYCLIKNHCLICTPKFYYGK